MVRRGAQLPRRLADALQEIAIGFLLAGFVAQLGNGFFNALFLTGSPRVIQAIWRAFIGPLIAVLSFVCSVGNVPLAAVLWSGGISFAGVMAFIFADLIIVPILVVYRSTTASDTQSGSPC
ncbi:MAG: permease [Solirubrobacteraceae bacterium]